MLGSVLDRITALFGRAFLISAFGPLLLFVGANAVTLALLGNGKLIYCWWLRWSDVQAVATAGFLLALVAGAYLLVVLSPVMRRLLEGAYRIWVLTDVLAWRSRRLFSRRYDRVLASKGICSEIQTSSEKWETDLILARKAAKEKPTQPDSGGATAKVARLVTGLRDELCKQGEYGALAERVREASQQVKELYDRGFPIRETEQVHDDLMRLWGDLETGATGECAQSLQRMQWRYDYHSGLSGVRPTGLGNIMASCWSYPYTRYGMDAALWWPRLQKVISPEYWRVVEDAKISYDACVVMAFLSALYATTWGVAGLLTGRLAWHATCFGLGLLGSALLYGAALQAAEALGECTRTCFDLFRFQLLPELRVALPADISSERKLWGTMNQIMLFGDTRAELSYVREQTAPPVTRSGRSAQPR